MDVLKNLGKQLSVVFLALVINTVALADTVTYFHNDISGSPLAASDAAGNLLWKENYKPYGEKLNQSAPSSSNKIGYHGKAFDDATGLSYMGARYYDPVLGRFMGIDPVDFQASNLHSFNRYTYANNNPYKYVDPDGRMAFLVVPVYALLTAIVTSAAVNSLSKSGSAGGSNDFNTGGSSYSGTDIGNPGNWSAGRVHNDSTDKNKGAEKSDEKSGSKSNTDERTRGRPWTGKPGSTTDRDAGGNARRYGNDGFPEVDYDDPHPNESGVGNGHHTHNWDRPTNGGPPTYKDRNKSTPYSPLPKR
jgi:RHS repeat-associated protein